MTASSRDAVVFDLDGTLIDSAADVIAVLNELLAADGLPAMPLAEGRIMIGGGPRDLIARAYAAAGRSLEPARLEALVGRYVALYAAAPAPRTTLYPGAVAALEALSASGERIGLCTNKPDGVARAVLAALGIERYFGAVVGGDAAPAAKPDARHLLAVIEALGASPARTVYVGDGRTDVITARNAGVPVVLVTYGYAGEPAARLGADALVDRLCELPALIARLWPRPT